jgi:hypothetical protein
MPKDPPCLPDSGSPGIFNNSHTRPRRCKMLLPLLLRIHLVQMTLSLFRRWSRQSKVLGPDRTSISQRLGSKPLPRPSTIQVHRNNMLIHINTRTHRLSVTKQTRWRYFAQAAAGRGCSKPVLRAPNAFVPCVATAWDRLSAVP